MAIAPIDLQTLFSQLDKVSKTHASQREGQAVQQAIQGVQLQKKLEEEINQVNEAQNTGEGAEKIKDRGNEPNSEQKNNGKRKNNSQNDDNKETAFILRDLSLGNNIDISF
jgi:hypothetical protein